MANGLSVNVTGLKELDRALSKLPEAVARAELASALEDGAKVIVEEAKRRVPVRTGKLRKAIKTGNVKRGKAEASVDVGIDYTFKGGAVRYGHLVEFGTKNRQPIEVIDISFNGYHFLISFKHEGCTSIGASQYPEKFKRRLNKTKTAKANN